MNLLLAIIKLAANPYLETPLINLMAHVRRHFFMESISLSFHSVKEHANLIKALEEGNPDKSAEIAKNHWTRSVNDFLKNS